MTNPPEAPAPSVPQRGLPWLLHLLVLLAVLGAFLGMVWSGSSDRIGRALAFAFFFVPLAVSYAITSTALVAAVHYGFGRRWRGWQCVALGHAIGVAAGAGATLFWVKGG